MVKAERKQESLEEVLNRSWKMMQRGVSRYNDPFHCPVLGTTGLSGSSMRTVILRQFISDERMLICHTDARADKVQEICKDAGIGWLFYHPKKRVQLRISGPATLHTDDRLADEQWAATKLVSRLNYCALKPPGSAVDGASSGLPDLLLNKAPNLLDTEYGRKNFMVIAGRIETMDWLQLSILGNRRARFNWDEKGLKSTWLIP